MLWDSDRVASRCPPVRDGDASSGWGAISNRGAESCCCGCCASMPGRASQFLLPQRLPVGVPTRGEPGGSCNRDNWPLPAYSKVPEFSGTIFERDARGMGDGSCCESRGGYCREGG